jgi:hypothetical protein
LTAPDSFKTQVKALPGEGTLQRIRILRGHSHHAHRLQLGAPLRGSRRLNALLNQARHGGRYFLGYPHPHVIQSPAGTRLYYHAYHRMSGGLISIDIGSCRLDGDQSPVDHQLALSPASNKAAWDSYFVGDPFVVAS